MSTPNWMDVQGLVGDSGPAAGPGAVPERAPAADPAADALLEGLNAAQREAVVHESGPMLILAGAGSGKTRVITRRIAWLIASGRVPAHGILAITFTNKAAREMRERVQAAIPVDGMWIHTFHAMGARILRRDIESLREGGARWTRDFSIYDTTDKTALIKTLIRDLGYDTTRFRPGLVAGWISTCKTAEVEEPVGAGGFEDEVLSKVRAKYDEALAANNALDFDDLLLLPLRLFEEHPGIRDLYAQRFQHVLVDEYQDTNRIQYRLTKHLAHAWGNVCVCGDPDQSIYSWRGADIRNILDFEEDFGAARVVKLEQNYRSTRVVLRAAQAVVQNNVGRKEKDLWSEREEGRLVGVLECSDENDEAEEIASQLESAHADGVAWSDMAVFYRVNFLQRALERALRLRGVPYQIVGGLEFYQRREVRDLIAYLRLAVNREDDVACERVVNVPQRGVGAKSVENLKGWAAERSLSLGRAIASEEARQSVRGRARKGLEAFHTFLEQLDGRADRPAAEVLSWVLEATEFLEWLEREGDEDASSRIDNVRELESHAETFDREYPDAGLRGFLQDVALVSDVDGMADETERVALMTLHAAKGLEFPFVVIAGMEEELLPHVRALQEAENSESALEEERRLFYVGLTRAQDRLQLTWAGRRFHFGESVPRMASRFLEEIPEDLVEGTDPERDEDDFLGAFEAPAGSAPKGLAVGALVAHDSFGRGRVARLQGDGINARATVDFAAHGTKHLLLQYAKLRVLED